MISTIKKIVNTNLDKPENQAIRDGKEQDLEVIVGFIAKCSEDIKIADRQRQNGNAPCQLGEGKREEWQ